MKTMTCKQLGGACNTKFQANTFDKIAELSKKHGMEMYQAADEDHINAMKKMQELIKSPKAMKEWFESKKNEFDTLPLD